MSNYSAYQDHLPSFKKLLEVVDTSTHPKRLLEFGLGESTLEFVKMFDHVHSVELFSPNLVPKDWYYSIEKKLGDNPKWTADLVEMTPAMRKIEEEIRLKNIVNNRVWDPESELAQDIREIVVNAINASEPDIIFVDCGSHCRGEILKFIMTTHEDYNANFLVAHDTSWPDLRYSYHLLQNLGNNGDVKTDWIKRQYFKEGAGTTIWMRSTNAIKRIREQRDKK
jgi:hypothetical protein